MGGKNVVMIMEDANLELAVEGCLWGGFGTTGQRCTAASRVVVHENVYEPFLDAFVARARELRVGDGLRPDTQVGPLVSEGQRETVVTYVDIGRQEGARLMCGGHALTTGAFAKGAFHEPTIFADVAPSMRIAQEEIFGPVACLIPFEDEAEAIRLANDIQYGLSSYVWTENLGKAHRVAAAIEAGMCFVNSQNVRDLRQPFGGTKASGTGREGGTWSFEVFLEPKNVCVSMGSHHIPHWGV
jgi:5-carboxymethyl-2-hydroxymuconic-semialdehyde dehydrogenase